MRKTKVDTIRWGEFVIGDYFSKLDLKCKKEKFNKRLDVSEEKSKEFSLPLVNAKYGNNGIMFYGREEDFDSEEMCLDIVKKWCRCNRECISTTTEDRGFEGCLSDKMCS